MTLISIIFACAVSLQAQSQGSLLMQGSGEEILFLNRWFDNGRFRQSRPLILPAIPSENFAGLGPDQFILAQHINDQKPVPKKTYVLPNSTPSAQLRANIMEGATRLSGAKYASGGCTISKGMDCSGFAWRVLRPAPKNKYGNKWSVEKFHEQTQKRDAKKPEEQIKKGDLIIWHDGKDSHIGFYAGKNSDGKKHLIVHASSEKQPAGTQAVREIADIKRDTPYYVVDTVKFLTGLTDDDLDQTVQTAKPGVQKPGRQGVDLYLPYVPSAKDLGLGPLRSAIYEPISGKLTLIGERQATDAPGVNPLYILELLASLERTAGEFPYFNLIPTAETVDLTVRLMQKRGPPVNPPEKFTIYRGRQAWKWAGFQEIGPEELTLEPRFSDPGLAFTESGRIMFEADLLLKKTMWEGPSTALQYLKWAESNGLASNRETASAVWLVADPASAGVALKVTGAAQALDIAEIKIKVFCSSHANIRDVLKNINQRTVNLSCSKDTRAGFHGRYFESNFEQLSQGYPVLSQLRELYKALLVAKLLYANSVTSASLGYSLPLEKSLPDSVKVQPSFIAGDIMAIFGAIGGAGGVNLYPSYPIKNLPKSLYGLDTNAGQMSVPIEDMNTPALAGIHLRAVQFLTK